MGQVLQHVPRLGGQPRNLLQPLQIHFFHSYRFSHAHHQSRYGFSRTSTFIHRAGEEIFLQYPSRPKLISSSPAHRELGLADLQVTAFWKKGIEGGSTEVQEKVVQLSQVEEGGEKDKNKQMFGFNLEAGVWIIEVKSTNLSFASYMGNLVLPFLSEKIAY